MPIRSIEMPTSALATVEPFQGLVFGDHGHAKDDAVCWDKYPRHEFFNCELNDCAAGNAIKKARHTGWRLVVDRDEDDAVSVEIGIDQDDNPAFNGINMGPYVAATKLALSSAAKTIPEQHDLLVRMLRLPQIYVYALWLHDEANANNDVIIPMAPAPAELPSGQTMTVAAFEDVIADLAKERLDAI
jgi:hypothetical protein